MVKCSLCGSQIYNVVGKRIVVCDYCGTKQIIKNNIENKRLHIKDELCEKREKARELSGKIVIGLDYIIGINKNGRVSVVGNPRKNCGQCNVQGWDHIITASANGMAYIGIKSRWGSCSYRR